MRGHWHDPTAKTQNCGNVLDPSRPSVRLSEFGKKYHSGNAMKNALSDCPVEMILPYKLHQSYGLPPSFSPKTSRPASPPRKFRGSYAEHIKLTYSRSPSPELDVYEEDHPRATSTTVPRAQGPPKDYFHTPDSYLLRGVGDEGFLAGGKGLGRSGKRRVGTYAYSPEPPVEFRNPSSRADREIYSLSPESPFHPECMDSGAGDAPLHNRKTSSFTYNFDDLCPQCVTLDRNRARHDSYARDHLPPAPSFTQGDLSYHSEHECRSKHFWQGDGDDEIVSLASGSYSAAAHTARVRAGAWLHTDSRSLRARSTDETAADAAPNVQFYENRFARSKTKTRNELGSGNILEWA